MFDMLAIVQAIFVIAKILNKVDWSWTTVFLPSYVYIIITVLIMIVSIIISIIDNR